MAKTREIRGRIKAVKNIQRITKTMQMIATARFQAAQRRAVQAQPYTRKIAELVGELAGSAANGGGVRHPLLSGPEPKTGRSLLLVLSSNRGLCGAYNANVMRTATGFLRQHAGQQVDVEVVGRKAMGYFRFAGVKVGAFHSHFNENPRYEDVQRVAEDYMQRFGEGHYDSVQVVYMAFESMSRQRARVLKLLPLENPAEQAPAGKAPAVATDYEYSPQREELLATLLPITVKTQLFQCFNEAVVSEQIARMVAMKSATDAASKMGKNLNRQFNRARQTAITTELSEIIGGAAALE